MLMEVLIQRQIPGSGLVKIFSFPIEVADLDKTEEDLSWLFEMFREKKYKIERREWDLRTVSEIVFTKPIHTSTILAHLKDIWVLQLKKYDSEENIKKYISSVLLKQP